MKTRNPIIHAACACGLLFTIQSGFAQGALTPPGAPAPTMKSLDQIEARTPISSAPYTISSSGSYYLTTNLTVSSGNAITIATNNVTLNLNGFTIASTTPSAAGTCILLAGGNANIAILNGFITGGVTNNGSVYGGSGFGYGIFYSGNNPSNVRVSHISVSGCLNDGISLYNISSTIVRVLHRKYGGRHRHICGIGKRFHSDQLWKH